MEASTPPPHQCNGGYSRPHPLPREAAFGTAIVPKRHIPYEVPKSRKVPVLADGLTFGGGGGGGVHGQ